MVTLNAITCNLTRRRQRRSDTIRVEQTQTRQGHMTMEEDERGAVTSQGKLGGSKSWEGEGTDSPQTLQKNRAPPTLPLQPINTDFGLLASSTMKEYIAVVLRHKACGYVLLQQS